MGTVAGFVPIASHIERASALPLRRLPSKPRSEAMRACWSRRAKRGTAKAARIPRMTMTTTSSISVKPLCEDLDIFNSEPNRL